MAMSHETCTHPRTPAGRAACRKAGGPDAYANANKIDAALPLPVKIVADALAPKTTRGRKSRAVASNLADLPRLARTVIDWADANDVTHTIHQGRGTAINLELAHAGVGYVTLTFDGEGVVANFRPVGTSIATRVASVNEALRMLKG